MSQMIQVQDEAGGTIIIRKLNLVILLAGNKAKYGYGTLLFAFIETACN